MMRDKATYSMLSKLIGNMLRMIAKARRAGNLDAELKITKVLFKHLIDLRKLNPLDMSLMTEEEITYIVENIIAMQDGVPYVPGTHWKKEPQMTV